MSAVRKTSGPNFRSAINLDESDHLVVGSDYSRAIVSGNFTALELLQCAVKHNITQICQKKSTTYDTDLKLSKLMIESPDLFFTNPISSILSPENSSPRAEKRLTLFSQVFRRAKEKGQTLENIRSTLEQNGRSESVISDLCMVADEMFTNAVFNAPFIDFKTQHNPGMDRNDESTAMGSNFTGRIFLGGDGDRLVVGCQDPFGSLGIPQLLSRIRDCSNAGASINIKMGAGGAGIGSYMVFNVGSGFYVAVRPGQASVVCCALHGKWSSRKRSEAPKSLHCITG